MINSIRLHDNQGSYLEFTEVTENNDIIVFLEDSYAGDFSFNLPKDQVVFLVCFLNSQLNNFNNG